MKHTATFQYGHRQFCDWYVRSNCLKNEEGNTLSYIGYAPVPHTTQCFVCLFVWSFLFCFVFDLLLRIVRLYARLSYYTKIFVLIARLYHMPDYLDIV